MHSTSIPVAKASFLSRIVKDYLAEAHCLQGFYKYSPNIGSISQVIADKQQQPLDRKILVRVLEEQYLSIGAGEQVLTNIRSITDGNTFTVTTAHQPNIFTGYLFFIYKIVATIHTCRQLAKQYPQYHFVPVYWMGSEDHDFEEISQINLYGEKLQWEHAHGGPVGRLDLDGFKEMIAHISAKLGSLPYAEEAVSLLHHAYQEGLTLGTATRRLVNELFGKYGVVIIDQDDAQLKQIFAKVLADEVLNSRVSGLVQGTIDEINRCQYKIQATPREINVFYLGNNSRERITWEEHKKQFQVLNSPTAFDTEAMEQDILAHPENYSPNVFLRPLYQETVLPNVAYIGGGGEVAYWLEQKAVFDHYQVNYPMLLLRPSIFLVDKQVAKKMEKLEMDFPQLMEEEEELIKGYVKKHSAQDLALTKEKQATAALFDSILVKASAIDPTLEKAVEGQKQAMLNSLEALETKLLRAEKRNFETATNQIKSIRSKLLPDNQPQERYDNFLPWYAAFGPQFLDEVIAACDPFANAVMFLQEDTQ
ncbi:MAG: bacillithiol biosynthesis cysteine-adding enzyme BshC [Chitinophagales bacterium]|nr:bacillithiol biosynthesis cysteine-adding enzyme BshC [Chitinophagales bacterium]